MPAVKELYEARASAWDKAKEVMEKAKAENRDLSAEEQGVYDAATAEVDSLAERIKREEDHATRAAEMDRINRDHLISQGTRSDEVDLPDEVYRKAFRSWMAGGASSEQRSVLQTRAGTLSAVEQRALGVGTGSAGGYAVPQGFRDVIVETMKAYSFVRRVASEIRTDTGNPLPWPTNNDVANVGAILAENTGISQQDVVLGQTTLGAYMYTSKLVLVSWQLLQDAAFDLETFLGRKLGQRIGRIQNQHFTTGTGTAQPLGIQTNATTGATFATGNTANITYAGLVALVYSVDPAYRSAPGAGWMLADAQLAQLRSLADSQGRPLWEPSLQAGQPDSFMGYPVYPNNDMPSQAANVKSILFGDFKSGYVIRDVLDIQMIRLDERYADALQVGFFAFCRTDATQQDASAYKAVAQSAT
jgi:HK97 family phage major capsid protein